MLVALLNIAMSQRMRWFLSEWPGTSVRWSRGDGADGVIALGFYIVVWEPEHVQSYKGCGAFAEKEAGHHHVFQETISECVASRGVFGSVTV